MLEQDQKTALEVFDRVVAIAADVSKAERQSLVKDSMADAPYAQDGLCLLDDGTFSQVLSGHGQSLPRLISNHAIVSCFLARFGATITSAELELLKSLLCGGSLRRASQDDGRSYQTKRNQVAALRSKAQVNSQAELLQIMSVLLANVAHSEQGARNEHAERLQALLDQFYQPHARLHRTSFSRGRELMVVDLGPKDGQPCFLMHPSVEPFVPLPDRSDFLEGANVRVLIPIRPGFFGCSLDMTNPKVSLNDFVDDCHEFLSSFDMKKLPILSITAGGMSGVLLANKLGEHCEQLIMCSPQYFGRAHEKPRSSYSAYWGQLIGRFQKLLMPVLSALAPLLINEKFAKKVWLKAYEDSPDDMRHVLALERTDWALDLVRAMIDCNLSGIDADLRLMTKDWIDLIGTLKGRTRVYYGETDPFSDHEYTTDLLRTAGVEVTVVPGFGQNSFLNRPDVLFGYLDQRSTIV